MKIRTSVMALLIFVILFGSIGLTSALGLWNTSTTKVPARITTGDASGAYNPADIRGSYSFGDISAAFGTPVEILATAFAVPASQDAAAFKVKELEGIWAERDTGALEVGTGSIRLFVAMYEGLPITLDEAIGLPAPAVDLLLGQPSITEEQRTFLETVRVAVP